jgi:hypothetical protein
MLMVWDLRPNVDIPSIPQSRSRSRSLSPSSPSGNSSLNGSSSGTRPQPTAYVISFPHALSSVCAHASNTKDLLIADVRGSLALIDWRSDPSHAQADAAWHHPRVIELAAPRAIAGGAAAFPASAAWQQANPDMYVSPLPSSRGVFIIPPFFLTLIDGTLTLHACPAFLLLVSAPYIVPVFPSGTSPSYTVVNQR